jgi:hypothetical protein
MLLKAGAENCNRLIVFCNGGRVAQRAFKSNSSDIGIKKNMNFIKINQYASAIMAGIILAHRVRRCFYRSVVRGRQNGAL